MRKIFLLAALVAAASGCSHFTSRFTEEQGVIEAYNNSTDDAVIIASGTEKPVPANRYIRFEVPILVAANPVSQQNGPSSIDKKVQISIAFRNLRTGRQTFPAICTAGAKVITTVSYRVYPGNEFYDHAPQCTSN